ncbi:MAG: hypothetical protein ACREA9_20120 [Pyrinomonadaceae bacterium]
MDIAESLAAAWNAQKVGQGDAEAVDFWPVCQLLADENLLETPEDQLAMVKIGPFRFAQTRYEEATQDFLEVLLPATMAGMASGQPLHAAVGGVLTAAGNTFVQLLRRGVTFGRDPVDRLRWLVLLHVKIENRHGVFPARVQVVRRLEPTHPNVEQALDWLVTTSATPLFRHEKLVLIKTRHDGGLEALV